MVLDAMRREFLASRKWAAALLKAVIEFEVLSLLLRSSACSRDDQAWKLGER